jgi:16S rRNA (cytidine1402-2'-O)-methyltransferase
MLYIVSTPIGNLEDITFRAIRILKEADYILAEDTRITSTLLNKYQVKKKHISFNDFNKRKKTPRIIKDLLTGKTIAVVSDSGTPGISDPGFYLVRECINNNIKVIPVPGANAVISALVSSGLPTDKFSFYGFLPKKQNQRKKLLQEISKRQETAILFESPHRIKKSLKDIAEVMPLKNIVIARELTKKFEEFIRGTCREVYDNLTDKNIKGEITIIIG